MARLARIVIPGLPHHVTQRGNRRDTVFFGDEDYRAYLDMLIAAVRKAESEVWAWCLMPNHVHLIIVPSHEDGLRQSVANAHRRYAARINARNRSTGAYVSLNPVRARLVKRAQDWKWSRVHAHLSGVDDGLTTVGPLLARMDDFAEFLDQTHMDEDYMALRKSEIIGRPIGGVSFIQSLEARLGQTPRRKKRGPRKKEG